MIRSKFSVTFHWYRMPKRRPRRLRNPFQEYIDTIRVAWIGFTDRFSYAWLSTQTDLELVRRIWASEAPRFSHQIMWDTRRLLPFCDEALATAMYQRTLDANQKLIDYFIEFSTMPFDLELQIQANQRHLDVAQTVLVDE